MLNSRKKLLRQKLRAQRKALSQKEFLYLNQRWAQNAMQYFRTIHYQCIAGYDAIGNEVGVAPLMDEIRANDNSTCLPVMEDTHLPTLSFHIFHGKQSELAKGPFGILQPTNRAVPLYPDIILVPLIGFDRFGNRIGYGQGYYDRAITPLPKGTQLIGCAYDFQEAAQIPREAHDIALDMVITPTRIIECGRDTR